MNIDKQIKETEKKLADLKKKKFEEENKKDFIYIKELNCEIQKNKHHLDKSYDDLVKEFGEEFLEKNLPTFDELQKLRNLESQGKYKLGLTDTWEFVKQEDLISKKKGYVSRLDAGSDGLSLGTGGDSSYSGSVLGVRFIKRNVKGK